MSWWRCYLCNIAQAVDNPGAVWWEHYTATHYRPYQSGKVGGEGGV